ncbi:MAG: alpha-glucosidase C-terminal domain-containing protein, partial [Kineosporiaceae bacterium]
VELRHREPVVALGDFSMLLPDDPQVYAFTRELDDVRLLVLANWSSADADVELPGGPDWAGAEVLLASGSSGEPEGPDADGHWRARPWNAVVLRRPLTP